MIIANRFAALALAAALAATPAAAQGASEVRIGGVCDRTGQTKIIGQELCQGVADYFALVNRKGGVQGHKLRYTDLDSGYDVPRAVDAYERLKQEGVVTVLNYGVPILYGLSSRYMEDRTPAFNTGTGRSDAIDGQAWPYIFPGTASYWSQAGAALKYLKDNGAKRGTRIAFLYFDNPAGREAIPMLEAVARREGYVLRLFPVKPPGLGMEPQAAEITNDFRADWVIGGLFGEAAAVGIKELKRAGFPLNRFLSFTYGAGEPDVAGAGWEASQGYLGLQYAAVGTANPVIQDLMRMYRDEGKEVPKFVGSAYYNRGVQIGAVMTEAIRLALQKEGPPLTGDKVRRGYESIRNFDAYKLGPPLTFTPQDHEGGGYLRVYQVKGTSWVPVSDWTRDYRDEVMALVKKANAK